ncbi:MAG: DUF4330 family protein [Clostridia bacterium]|nr:DUF4330 family protein [Clostridia bacterium]
MSTNNRKKGSSGRASFNAIDLAIVLLIIICGVGIFFRYDMENKISAGEGETYEVEFVCEKVRYTTADYLNVGDTLYFSDSLSVFGNIQGTLVNRPSFEEVSYGGKNITAYYPQDTMVDITGNVSVTGTMTENGFLVSGNTYIAPNSVIRVSGKYVDIEIKVLSLKKIEPN